MRNQRYDVPPLAPLLAFEAAARNRAFRLAAAALQRTQAGVSRQFLVDMRRALLQQLSVVERQLNIQYRCKQCGYDLSR